MPAECGMHRGSHKFWRTTGRQPTHGDTPHKRLEGNRLRTGFSRGDQGLNFVGADPVKIECTALPQPRRLPTYLGRGYLCSEPSWRYCCWKLWQHETSVPVGGQLPLASAASQCLGGGGGSIGFCGLVADPSIGAVRCGHLSGFKHNPIW